METDLSRYNENTFEGIKHLTEEGIEFWYARDLQTVLEYTEWRNFETVINKAKEACNTSGNNMSDHFVDVNKMVPIGSRTQREIEDIMLSRYACYLTAQNGDPKKPEIAFAQTDEHVANNQAVRKTLLARGIRPESLPPARLHMRVCRRFAGS